MNILKKRNGLIGQSELIYCGRGGEDDLGLGNPFGWKKGGKQKFQVGDLKESMNGYHEWLFKILKAWVENPEMPNNEPWEKRYASRVVKLAIQIKAGKVKGLICYCINLQNYQPQKGGRRSCHAQHLFSACLWLIQSHVV